MKYIIKDIPYYQKLLDIVNVKLDYWNQRIKLTEITYLLNPKRGISLTKTIEKLKVRIEAGKKASHSIRQMIYIKQNPDKKIRRRVSKNNLVDDKEI